MLKCNQILFSTATNLLRKLFLFINRYCQHYRGVYILMCSFEIGTSLIIIARSRQLIFGYWMSSLGVERPYHSKHFKNSVLRNISTFKCAREVNLVTVRFEFDESRKHDFD